MIRDKMIEFVRKQFDDGFLVIDLETTGFATDPAVEIIEVAVIDHEGEILLDELVKPRQRIPRAASRINGIYDKDVATAQVFAAVYPRLAEVLHHKHVFAYNDTFEKTVLAREIERNQVDLLRNAGWHCAMRTYRKFAGLPHFTKLTLACDAEGITVENAHRALGDCLMTLELLKKIAGR